MLLLLQSLLFRPLYCLIFLNAFVFPSLTKGKRAGDTFANGNGENYIDSANIS
jgi:hypothetical protein